MIGKDTRKITNRETKNAVFLSRFLNDIKMTKVFPNRSGCPIMEMNFAVFCLFSIIGLAG